MKHVKIVVGKLVSTRLPDARNPDAEHRGMYDIAPMCYEGQGVLKPPQVPSAVHIFDRVADMEAMLIGFLTVRSCLQTQVRFLDFSG